MARGGYRPNAGRKKGSKTCKVSASAKINAIERRAQRRALGQYKDTAQAAILAGIQQTAEMVLKELEPIVKAQLANAKGLNYLVVRDKKTGKFIRVSKAMAKEKLDKNEEVVEVWEKDPSVQAFADLMNRTFGRPAEYVDPNKKDEPIKIVIAWKNSES
jgi:hypothetical protein